MSFFFVNELISLQECFPVMPNSRHVLKCLRPAIRGQIGVDNLLETILSIWSLCAKESIQKLSGS